MTFSELPLHPAIALALAARGYGTPTGVQAAVLDPGNAGRDLLISSQTGSGKTIAFGAALVQTLLGDGKAKLPHGPRPVALAIVPTRELATQVRDELAWLLLGTGVRLASFTGGTAVTGDLRALQRGVDLVIGTPGRLVDLARRGRLELGDVKVLVLDEADEMLDLGFRDDLETLLKAAPSTRRTLMLSATLPPEIRALAKRFQRDALAVDPRRPPRATTPGTAGAAADPGGGVTGASAPAQARPAPHEDITFVAHLIAGGDRLAAVVNLLRVSDTARAIVFCTTREGVGTLHQQLTARGFAATAISGDRAQAERDRALASVRSGETRILVATNVAARGLHLPDVDLIVHADLPLNAESLTHRSGRTGRAGRKGTAVVLAHVAERRKAERLLAAAHVRVPWTAPPSAKDIDAAARERLIETLLGDAGATAALALAAVAVDGGGGGGDTGGAALPPAKPKSAKTAKPVETPKTKTAETADAAAEEIVRRLEARIAVRELARRLVVRELARLPGGEPLKPVAVPPPSSPAAGGGREDGGAPRKRSPADLAREGVLFRVNLGARNQADPRWLLPLICRRGGVTRHDVGAIRIGPEETLFEIAPAAAQDFALAAAEIDPRARHVRMERVLDRGKAADHPPRQQQHQHQPHPPRQHQPHPPRQHQPHPPRQHQPHPPGGGGDRPPPERKPHPKGKPKHRPPSDR